MKYATILLTSTKWFSWVPAFNTVRGNLRGEQPITQEHVKNNTTVRSALGQSNIYPEKLPPAEDVKKIDRKIKSESKKLPKSTRVLSDE